MLKQSRQLGPPVRRVPALRAVLDELPLPAGTLRPAVRSGPCSRPPLRGAGGQVGVGLVAEVLEDPEGVLVVVVVVTGPALLLVRLLLPSPALRLLAGRVGAGAAGPAAAASVPLQLG